MSKSDRIIDALGIKEYQKEFRQDEQTLFYYRPSKDVEKVILFKTVEHWNQFEALLKEAGYKDIAE